jgi:Alkylmercury lyase
MEKPVGPLGIDRLSKSQVSEMSKDLDEQVAAYAGHTGNECAGALRSVCCDYMNFFATGAAAATWAALHPDISGGVLGQRRALKIGISIFGQLLS